MMPNINLVIPHLLSPEEALLRIKTRLNKLKEEHPDKISEVREEWIGNIGQYSFVAMGMKFAGTLTIENNQVILDGELPLLAIFYKTEIEKKIRQEAEKLLTAN
ncbi:MAG: polyhydroxyalkanoic acid system family protein [bacterium]|nr:polyhydroxyalkanoic acid system family protein [bacterium]